MSKSESVANLRRCLTVANARLAESFRDYEDLLYVAMTGEGLRELRDNSFHQATIRRIIARRDRPPIPFRRTATRGTDEIA